MKHNFWELTKPMLNNGTVGRTPYFLLGLRGEVLFVQRNGFIVPKVRAHMV